MLLAFIVFFPLVLSGNTLLIAVAIVFLLCVAQFHAGAQPAYFAEAFPTEIRYRGPRSPTTWPWWLAAARRLPQP